MYVEPVSTVPKHFHTTIGMVIFIDKRTSRCFCGESNMRSGIQWVISCCYKSTRGRAGGTRFVKQNRYNRYVHNIHGLGQDCSNSIANALELLHSCAKPSICRYFEKCHYKAIDSLSKSQLQNPLNCYRQTSNIRRTLVGNIIVDISEVVGASPVGAAPTTSSLST